MISLVKESGSILKEGTPYMAMVKIIPFYADGDPQPRMFKFGSIFPVQNKSKKPEQEEDEGLRSSSSGEQLL